MSTVADIEHALETLAPEQWLEIRHWMDCRIPRPDFLARQKAIFGERVLADSQAVLDELRADHR